MSSRGSRRRTWPADRAAPSTDLAPFHSVITPCVLRTAARYRT
jgi:hypothetical protein